MVRTVACYYCVLITVSVNKSPGEADGGEHNSFYSAAVQVWSTVNSQQIKLGDLVVYAHTKESEGVACCVDQS